MTCSQPQEPRPGRDALLLAYLLLATILYAALFSGCSPRVVEHIVHQRDTTYIEHLRVDSIARRDSIFVKEQGDTLYIYKERVLERLRYVHDTTAIVRVDSVLVETPVPVPTHIPLTKWEKAKMGAFWWLLGAVALLLAWVLRKPLRLLLRI